MAKRLRVFECTLCINVFVCIDESECTICTFVVWQMRSSNGSLLCESNSGDTQRYAHVQYFSLPLLLTQSLFLSIGVSFFRWIYFHIFMFCSPRSCRCALFSLLVLNSTICASTCQTVRNMIFIILPKQRLTRKCILFIPSEQTRAKKTNLKLSAWMWLVKWSLFICPISAVDDRQRRNQMFIYLLLFFSSVGSRHRRVSASCDLAPSIYLFFTIHSHFS